jgi:CdiI immunity protein
MKKRTPRGSDFPALASLVRGYLHEDFPEVHGSAVAAATAFCADAGPDERSRLAQELEALAAFAANRPVRDLQRFLTRDLGSRWEPKSRKEIVELLDTVRTTI